MYHLLAPSVPWLTSGKGAPYTCRPSGGADDVAENNGEKVTGSEKNNSENVSRLNNWPDRRDTLNDGVENVDRSKVNLHCRASAREKQHDRKDISSDTMMIRKQVTHHNKETKR